MKRILLAVLLLLIVEVIVIAAVGQFMLLAELKRHYTIDAAIQLLQQQLQAPLSTVTAFIRAKNPLFWIGTIGAVVAVAYVLLLPKSHSQGWHVHEKNAYHGSARWARKHEVFDGNYEGLPLKKLQQQVTKKLEGR